MFKRIKNVVNEDTGIMRALDIGIIVTFVVQIVCVVLGVSYQVIYTNNTSSIPTSVELNDNVLVTAAHLGDVDGYKLMYEDDSRDVAYYLKKGLDLTTIPNQSVNIKGLEDCNIVDSEPGVFYVKTSTPENIVNGMSGERVYDSNNNAIGFVDAMVKDQKIKCITLE